jgi:hypothetical protein
VRSLDSQVCSLVIASLLLASSVPCPDSGSPVSDSRARAAHAAHDHGGGDAVGAGHSADEGPSHHVNHSAQSEHAHPPAGEPAHASARTSDDPTLPQLAAPCACGCDSLPARSQARGSRLSDFVPAVARLAEPPFDRLDHPTLDARLAPAPPRDREPVPI